MMEFRLMKPTHENWETGKPEDEGIEDELRSTIFDSRSLIILCLLFTALAGSGCTSIQAGIHYLSLHVIFQRDGYTIRDD